MKSASIKEIKSCLASLEKDELIAHILRLAKLKNENKELLNFLLLEEDNLDDYIQRIKWEIDEAFEALNLTSYFLAKKTIRKTIKIANKHIKFCGKIEVEADLLIYVCAKIKNSALLIDKSPVLKNLYTALHKRIIMAMSKMHPDLQYDYQKQLAEILI